MRCLASLSKRKYLFASFSLTPCFYSWLLLFTACLGRNGQKLGGFRKEKHKNAQIYRASISVSSTADTKRRRAEREERETESNVFDMVLGEKCD